MPSLPLVPFSKMPYERPDVEEIKKQTAALTEKLKQAASYEQARRIFLEKDDLDRSVQRPAELASIRHSINTLDEFYKSEMDFWNSASPELEEYDHAFTEALLDSPFRRNFEEEYGNVLFLNAELARKSFRPELIPDMKRENDLVQEYEALLASAQIPFRGKVYTLSQLEPWKADPDDNIRLEAWKAEGTWYNENGEKLDQLYDELTHLRDGMGKKLGYKNYLPLGYCRMERNCYTKEDLAEFRRAVVKYIVPLAETIYRQQARRLGKEYPMSFADNALKFRSGNPKPVGTAEEILQQGLEFYTDLSPETAEFFKTMMDCQLLDVLSTKGKEGGGYCTFIPEYGVPFIFANFNGTEGDIGVVTHEAGHAFEAWTNRDRVPLSYVWPSSEACEVHSMSMEFFAYKWAPNFFGPDTRKFYYSHLSEALTFIPYGTMVDDFQHQMYEHPEYTPAMRHEVWRRLSAVYMPWEKLDGEIPFWSEGKSWQYKHHIYSFPLYYIDYCLAQTVALEFWALMQQDNDGAWNKYMAYTRQGGSRTFTELLKHAGLGDPFDENTLRSVAQAAGSWLERYDMTGIK